MFIFYWVLKILLNCIINILCMNVSPFFPWVSFFPHKPNPPVKEKKYLTKEVLCFVVTVLLGWQQWESCVAFLSHIASLAALHPELISECFIFQRSDSSLAQAWGIQILYSLWSAKSWMTTHEALYIPPGVFFLCLPGIAKEGSCQTPESMEYIGTVEYIQGDTSSQSALRKSVFHTCLPETQQHENEPEHGKYSDL